MLLHSLKEVEIYNCLLCIYGTFLGDELGSFCEFSRTNQVNHLKLNNEKNVFAKLQEQNQIQKW